METVCMPHHARTFLTPRLFVVTRNYLCIHVKVWSIWALIWFCSSWALINLSQYALWIKTSTIRLLVVSTMFQGSSWFVCPLDSISISPIFEFAPMLFSSWLKVSYESSTFTTSLELFRFSSRIQTQSLMSSLTPFTRSSLFSFFLQSSH